MLRQFSMRRITVFFLLDWFGTIGTLLFSIFLYFGLQDRAVSPYLFFELVKSGWEDNLPSILPFEVIVLIAIIWPLFLVRFKVYNGRYNATLARELQNVILAVLLATLTLAGVLFFTYRLATRQIILLFLVFNLLFLCSSRIVLWLYRRRWPDTKEEERRRNVLIIGAGPVGLDVVTQLRQLDWSNLNLIGYVDDSSQKQENQLLGLPVLGTLRDIPALLKEYHIQDAVVALPLYAHEQLITVCQKLQDRYVRVYVVPDLFAFTFPNATLDVFGGIPLLDLGLPTISGWQLAIKRTFDLVIVSLCLIAASPLLLLAALLIKLDSEGPVFYRQRRIGQNGQPFTMFKFRSMRADTDDELHRTHVTRLIRENLDPGQLGNNTSGTLKLQADPRITQIGAFIRKTSIDELPQLFNVLRGDMSLVGPRPALPYEVELYKKWHKRRLDALPGITGWWQVKGRNRVSFDEAVRMDIYYIERQSIWFDIKILLLTPWAIIFESGAG